MPAEIPRCRRVKATTSRILDRYRAVTSCAGGLQLSPLSCRFRHHLLYCGFNPCSGLCIMRDPAPLKVSPRVQAILAGAPLLGLRSGGSRIGQPLQSIQLGRTGRTLGFGLLVLLLRAFGHVSAFWR